MENSYVPSTFTNFEIVWHGIGDEGEGMDGPRLGPPIVGPDTEFSLYILYDISIDFTQRFLYEMLSGEDILSILCA